MRPYFFTFMRLLPYLVISILAHTLVLIGFQFITPITPMFNRHNQPLQVLIVDKPIMEKPGLILGLNPNNKESNNKESADIKQVSKADKISKIEDKNAMTKHTAKPYLNSDITDLTTAQDSIETMNASDLAEVDYSNYYATADVDRKALPQINIDESQIQSDTYSGFPIKLRLYISASGKLAKIEPISVLDQDREYVAQLQKLLFQLVFLPAKKDGLDVDSYQDLQLSFNPLAPINGTSDTQ